MDNNQDDRFTALFISFSDALQRYFRRALIVLGIGLLLMQLVLRIPVVRSMISSAERWEGERVELNWIQQKRGGS